MLSPLLPVYTRVELDFSHGLGMYLFTTDGKKYLDFGAGYAAMALGHCHPKMVETLCIQAGKLWHVSNKYKIPGLKEYCKRLCDISFADTVFVANAGAEAVECAIKMARRYFNEKGDLKRYRIITFDGAFHGRTLATATAGSAEKIIGFEPPVDGFDRIPFGDIEALKRALNETTAAVLIEPIQGEGGMRANTQEYMSELEKICKKKGVLIIVDEVQCGMGRTGHMFAYEMYGIKPDLMALGKGLGAGFPISACLATAKVGKAMKAGSHGSTFGGNPLAVAIGHTVLDLLLEDNFLKNVNKQAKYMRQMLEKLKAKHPTKITKITGEGLMLGLNLKDGYSVDQFFYLCADQGLLSMPASKNVLRITPPLIIEEHHIDEAYIKFDEALSKLDSTFEKVKHKVRKVVQKVGASLG